MVDFSPKLSASSQPASQPASPLARSAPPPSPPPPDDPELRAGHAVHNDQSARARVLFDLPDDVLVRILSQLKPGEQKPTLAVSRRMNRVARQAVQKITVSDTENLSAALPRFAKGGLKRITYVASHVVTQADWDLVHGMQLWRGRGWVGYVFNAPEKLERRLSLMLPVHGVRLDIQLSGHRIRDQELWLLASEKGQALGIHELHLNGCPSITDAGLAHIDKLRDLRVLRVTGCPRLTDAALERLKAEFELRDSPLTVVRVTAQG
jgi:F-box-like